MLAPLLGHGLEEVGIAMRALGRAGDLDLDDQQGQGDGENRVAEPLEAVQPPFGAVGRVPLGHKGTTPSRIHSFPYRQSLGNPADPVRSPVHRLAAPWHAVRGRESDSHKALSFQGPLARDDLVPEFLDPGDAGGGLPGLVQGEEVAFLAAGRQGLESLGKFRI